jgi:hypothetical protein
VEGQLINHQAEASAPHLAGLGSFPVALGRICISAFTCSFLLNCATASSDRYPADSPVKRLCSRSDVDDDKIRDLVSSVMNVIQ